MCDICFKYDTRGQLGNKEFCMNMYRRTGYFSFRSIPQGLELLLKYLMPIFITSRTDTIVGCDGI